MRTYYVMCIYIYTRVFQSYLNFMHERFQVPTPISITFRKKRSFVQKKDVAFHFVSLEYHVALILFYLTVFP